MHIQVPHNTSASAAVGRIKTALNEHRGQLMQHVKIDKEEWDGNTLNFEIELQGKKIPGSLAATDTEYILDATLPLMWRLFEGKIEKEIEKQIQGMK